MIPPVGASWRLEKRIEGASPASWRYAREQWRGLDWRLFVCGKEMKKQTSRLAGGAGNATATPRYILGRLRQAFRKQKRRSKLVGLHG